MAEFKDPWSEAGNQAVGALFKYMMSQPNPAELEAQALQNELVQKQMRNSDLAYSSGMFDLNKSRSEYETANKFADAFGSVPQISGPVPTNGSMGPVKPFTQADRDNSFSQVFQQFAPRLSKDTLEATTGALNAATGLQFANALSAAPQVGTETPLTPGQYGPNPAVTSVDRNSAMANILEQFAPRLDSDMVTASRDALGAANALRFENPIDRQLALDEKATTYGAYSEGMEQEFQNKLKEPYTLSPGSVRFGADNQQLASAPFKTGGGSSVTLADGTIISLDGGVPEMTSATSNMVQRQQIEGAKFYRMAQYTKNMAMKDPTNFGFPGYVKGTLQDVGMLLTGVSQAMGYDAPEKAFKQIVENEKNNPNLSRDMLFGLYDPRLNAIDKAANLLVYQAAAALASQEGRSISDADVTLFRGIVGDPQSFFMNQQKFVSGIDAMTDFLSLQQEVLTDAAGSNIVGQEYPKANPDQFDPSPAGVEYDYVPGQGLVPRGQ